MDEIKPRLDADQAGSESNQIGGGSPSPAPVAPAPAADRPRDPRGRHKKDCLCAVCRSRRGEKVGNARPVQDRPGAGVLAVAPAIDPQLIKDTVGRLADIVSDMTQRRVEKLATTATGDPKLAGELAEDVALTPNERETIVELTASLAEKYRVAMQYAPEAALLLCVAGYGWRVSRVQSQLAELIKTQRAVIAKPEPAK